MTSDGAIQILLPLSHFKTGLIIAKQLVKKISKIEWIFVNK